MSYIQFCMVRKGVQPSYACTLGNRKRSRLSCCAPESGKLTRKAVPGSMELISVRPAPHHGPPMPRKSRPRRRSVTIKGKEFYQVSVPQPGGGRRLRTFKNPDEAKRFYAAVQGELRPGTEVRSIKRSFPGAALGLEKERKRMLQDGARRSLRGSPLS